MFLTEEEIYTPDEAAIRLKLFLKNGKPNGAFVRSLCRNGHLEYIKFSERTIRINEAAIKDFIEGNTCQRKTKENSSPSEKTEDGGELLNISTGTDVGMIAAMQAEKRLKQRLQCGTSANAGMR